MFLWCFTNLGLAALLPPAVLWFCLLLNLDTKARARLSPWLSVNGGQLSWVTLNMCLTASYDLHHSSAFVQGAATVEVLSSSLTILALFATLSAALGPALSADKTSDDESSRWVERNRMFVASVFMLVAGMFLYARVHLLTAA
jgi:hypothetical protein